MGNGEVHPLSDAQCPGHRDSPRSYSRGRSCNAFLIALAAHPVAADDYRLWLGPQPSAWRVSLHRPGLGPVAAPPDHVGMNWSWWQQALGFIAMVFPLQADAAWIALGGRWKTYHHSRLRPCRCGSTLRGLGAALLILRGCLLFVDPGADRPVRAGLTATPCRHGSGGVHAGGGPGVRPAPLLPGPPPTSTRWPASVAGLAGVLLVWPILSLDTYQYFTTQQARERCRAPWSTWATTSLWVLWPVYAALPVCRLQAEQQASAGPG